MELVLFGVRYFTERKDRLLTECCNVVLLRSDRVEGSRSVADATSPETALRGCDALSDQKKKKKRLIQIIHRQKEESRKSAAVALRRQAAGGFAGHSPVSFFPFSLPVMCTLVVKVHTLSRTHTHTTRTVFHLRQPLLFPFVVDSLSYSGCARSLSYTSFHPVLTNTPPPSCRTALFTSTMDATYHEPSSAAMPISYAVLSLPTKAAMRKKGYDPNQTNYNGGGHATHPLATWKTFSLPDGCTYKAALSAVQKANDKPWGPIKIRLNFSDGHYEQFERTNPESKESFQSTASYDPNDVFKAETLSRSTARRAQQEPRLKPLVNEQGHHLSSKPIPRTFAPEELYKNCPPPVLSQAGYDFTPVSYNSFLLKPQDPPQGVRNVQSGYMHSSCDYRPRSYLRPGGTTGTTGAGHASRHCHCNEVFQVGDYTMDFARDGETVDHRNRLTKKEYSPIGTLKANSTVVGRRHACQPRFACSSKAKATATATETQPQESSVAAQQRETAAPEGVA
jgi:hypothetical protein